MAASSFTEHPELFGGGGMGGGGAATGYKKPRLGSPGVVIPPSTPGGPGSPGIGGGGGPLAPPMPDLTVTAKPSPEMQASIEAWKKRMAELEGLAGKTDPNLQAQIDLYKQRMSEDPQKKAIAEAAAAIRSQAAGMGEGANAAGARSGRGEGMGAAGIGDMAQASLAKSAANIELGRQQQLDQLLLGGQSIMAAPGQQQFAYQGLLNQGYGQNPYAATAGLGIAQQNLGLQGYLGQLEAQARLAEAQARAYGSPLDWYQMLLGGGGIGGL